MKPEQTLLAFIVFALSVIVYVAVGFMTKPMFDGKHKHEKKHRWHVSKELLQYLQAFSIIYWFLLAVTVATVLVRAGNGQALVSGSDDTGCVIVHIVILAILVINAVAVGFITQQVWSKHAKHHHELVFTKGQLVMVQIFVVLTWVMLGVSVIGNVSVFGGKPAPGHPDTIEHAVTDTLTHGPPGLTHA